MDSTLRTESIPDTHSYATTKIILATGGIQWTYFGYCLSIPKYIYNHFITLTADFSYCESTADWSRKIKQS